MKKESYDGEASVAAVKPTLRMVEHYAVPTGEAELQLRSAKKSMSLRGGAVQKLLPLVMPLLDGTHTEEQIIALLDGKLDADRVRSILKALIDKELVEQITPPPAVTPPIDWTRYETVQRYFAAHTGSRYEVLAAVRQANVALIGATMGAAPLAAALGHLGLAHITVVDDARVSRLEAAESPLCTPEDEGRSCAQLLKERLTFDDPAVKITADERMPQSVSEWCSRLEGASFAVFSVAGPALFQASLEAFNQAALELSLPWTTLAWLDDRTVQIGPTVVPGVTACHRCLVEQFERNTSLLGSYGPFQKMVKEAGAGPAGPGAPIAEWPASLLSVEVIRALSHGQQAATYGRMLTIDLLTLEVSFHPVNKLPRCTACGPTRDTPRMRIWS